jgi:hypothetical protein
MRARERVSLSSLFRPSGKSMELSHQKNVNGFAGRMSFDCSVLTPAPFSIWKHKNSLHWSWTPPSWPDASTTDPSDVGLNYKRAGEDFTIDDSNLQRKTAMVLASVASLETSESDGTRPAFGNPPSAKSRRAMAGRKKDMNKTKNKIRPLPTPSPPRYLEIGPLPKVPSGDHRWASHL